MRSERERVHYAQGEAGKIREEWQKVGISTGTGSGKEDYMEWGKKILREYKLGSMNCFAYLNKTKMF